MIIGIFQKPSIDLVFLIDDSGSIPGAQFTVAKEGAATLSQALCPHTFGNNTMLFMLYNHLIVNNIMLFYVVNKIVSSAQQVEPFKCN